MWNYYESKFHKVDKKWNCLVGKVHKMDKNGWEAKSHVFSLRVTKILARNRPNG